MNPARSDVRPKVFLSYTAEDLREHADAAQRAARSLEIELVDHRDWPASGQPSVKECRERVASCDALIVLVAHRYGWVPKPEDGGDGERSITWLEVEEARRLGRTVLPFLVKKDAAWPVDLIEGLDNPAALQGLQRFKELLGKGIAAFFTNPESLQAAVATSLAQLEKRLRAEAPARGRHVRDEADDIQSYRQRLERQTRKVELVGFGEQFQVHLSIDELYVPLRAQLPHRFERGEEAGWPKALEAAERIEAVSLEDAFRKARDQDLRGVVLLGEPGSGKTTAARRICWRAADLVQGPEALGLPDDVAPVLLRLRAVRAEHLAGRLEGFLCAQLALPSSAGATGLGERLLARGKLLWILDGLDEVADAHTRAAVSGWVREAESQRPDDWFLVTSRFAGYEGEVQLARGFLELHVQPLDANQQQDFVRRWYATVERRVRGSDPASLGIAAARAAALTEVLSGADFRARRLASMVANPLLLSILCVVHRKDMDLPRRRADLYQKCLDVLLESWRKEWRKEWGRDGFDAGVARLVLEPLAWHLHALERRDGAHDELVPVVESALARISGAIELDRDPRAFLESVRNDSGLLVSAEPGRYAFLHQTFQEYLAARHAAASIDPAELARHFGEPWWSEVILLAASLASSERFVKELLEAVLRSGAWEKHDELAGFLVDEALMLPIEPFVAALRDPTTPPQRLAAILRVGSMSPDFVDAARRLEESSDALVRGQAYDILVRSGEIRPANLLPSADTLPEALDRRTGVSFVRIPAGEFQMGGKAHSDEQPIHRVKIERAFLLAQTPVTNAQYERFLKATGHAQPQFWTDRKYNRPDQPVVGVSWEDAVAYCKWAGYALPSEAQWEYACRAGTTTEYWSGNSDEDMERAGWCSSNSERRLHSVAEKSANPWGLFDMHGNVWEWCEDEWSDNYSKSQRSHPDAYTVKGAGRRVLRGGSFRNSARLARSACRYYWLPGLRDDDLGFRPAKGITTD